MKTKGPRGMMLVISNKIARLYPMKNGEVQMHEAVEVSARGSDAVKKEPLSPYLLRRLWTMLTRYSGSLKHLYIFATTDAVKSVEENLPQKTAVSGIFSGNFIHTDPQELANHISQKEATSAKLEAFDRVAQKHEAELELELATPLRKKHTVR